MFTGRSERVRDEREIMCETEWALTDSVSQIRSLTETESEAEGGTGIRFRVKL